MSSIVPKRAITSRPPGPATANRLRRPEEDIDNRLPVWSALQLVFMDTDPAVLIDYIAEACARSPYSVEDIERILFNEVLPACRFNMFAGVAPEWAGFEEDWLKQHVLKSHRFGRPRPWLLRRYTRKWWKRLAPLIAAHRSK